MSSSHLPVPNGLYWCKPHAGEDAYELRDAEACVRGTVRFLPKPAVTWGYTDRRRARGQAGSLGWDLSIERKGLSGFFGTSATAFIDEGATGTLLAGPFFATGALSLASGRRLRWKGSIFKRTTCAFLDESGRVLVQISPGSFVRREIGSVAVEAGAADLPDWPLLVTLALYLRLLMNRVWD